MVYWIKDKDKEMRKILLDKLASSNEIYYSDIHANGLCYLIGFCELMKED